MTADGVATGVNSEGNLVLTIAESGAATPKVEVSEGSDCLGKTLEELRAEGRVLESR